MKASESHDKALPEPIKVGNVILPIYPETTFANTSAGKKKYTRWVIRYQEGTEWKRLRFSKLAKAQQKGFSIATKIQNREAEALKLSSHDAMIFVQANEFVKPLGV